MIVERPPMEKKPGRRELRFENFEQVATELDMLARGGYHRAGTWSLGQMCEHLARVMEFSLDGFPRMSFYFSLMRPLVRALYLKKVLAGGQLPAGVSAPNSMQPGDAADDESGVERLKAVIARVEAPSAKFHPSPVFGNLTADQWRKVHLWHCAHHLGFLIPAS